MLKYSLLGLLLGFALITFVQGQDQSAMERFFKRAREDSVETPVSTPIDTNAVQNEPSPNIIPRSRINIDLSNLPSDPVLRPRISDYDVNYQDKIRRSYLQLGPCQPYSHTFPKTNMGNKVRRFNTDWFAEFPSWLEYSVKENSAFCLVCYLFYDESPDRNKSDVFVRGGFCNWKCKRRLNEHASSIGHHTAYMRSQNLLNQDQHIETIIHKQSKECRVEYHRRLVATIDVVRFLLRQGLSFRSHDESEKSMNKGNFLELLEFLARREALVNNVVLNNAPGNLKLTSPDIQKDVVNAIASAVIKEILNDLGGDLFAILIDEARDVSIKEQMAIVVRYVDKRGFVIERFMGMVHVPDTTSLSLKASLDQFFNKHNLSIKNLRGQGYDGASNMQGTYNGLKSLILKENKSAYYVHCFAHQLQLALVKVAKDLKHIDEFFFSVNMIVNMSSASCKRRDILRKKEVERIFSQLELGETSSGRGLNQETSMKRPGDTRWNSHYGTLINLMVMFGSVVDVLDELGDNGTDRRGEAVALQMKMQTFDFVFNMHLMKNILSITNILSKLLQKKDQDILNAMDSVRVAKGRFQTMRDEGWGNLLMEVSSFCTKYEIVVPNMEDNFCLLGRVRRGPVVTNLHHYKVDIFFQCVDKQLVELNHRFDEVNSELLICMTAFDPKFQFASFDVNLLVRLSEFYTEDFTEEERIELRDELVNFQFDVKSNRHFDEVEGISGLAKKMVEKGKHLAYGLVYRLLKLSLILPVSTASVERAFSAMNIIKTDLRNRMGDAWLNDTCITYIEKDVFDVISNDVIVNRFQKMKNRRGIL